MLNTLVRNHNNLPFAVDANLVYQLHLLMKHVVDTLTHSSVSLFSFLRLCESLLFLFAIDSFFLHNFLLVFFQVRLDIFGNFGQIHELTFDLCIEFIQLIDFDVSFIYEHLRSKSSAGISAFNRGSKTTPVTISRVYWGPYRSLTLALLVRH